MIDDRNAKASLSKNEFLDRLNHANQRREDRISALRKRLDQSSLCLFGYGGKGKTLADHLRNRLGLDLIVFDNSASNLMRAERDGFNTVSSLNEIDKRRFFTILGACQHQLQQAEEVQENYVFYQEAAYLFNMPFLFDNSIDFTDVLLDYSSGFYEVYSRIADSSKPAFLDILCFRLSLDPRDIDASRKPNSEMWFDLIESASHRKLRSFLDVGAYDGDTLKVARDRLGITRGIAVEANLSLIPRINELRPSFKDGLEILPHAAWSHACDLHFEEVRNGMIQVHEASGGGIHAAPIDSFVLDDVDYLKMDIEGSEMMALAGAEKLLIRSTPDVALAAYHRPLDTISLFNFFQRDSLKDKYDSFHFAHYSQCFDDTILYCFAKS
jgi:FkbM family methyltransferase